MTRLAALAVALLLAAGFVAAPAGAQSDDIPDECRTIIGCPDAGPAPENPGDRGGYAQLMTLGALALGVGFIMVRVVRAARASQPDPGG